MSEKVENIIADPERAELLSLGNGKISRDLQIARPVYRQEELNEASRYEKPSSSIKHAIASRFRFRCSCLSFWSDLLPVLKWLPKYDWKRDILSDIISGTTVAIMHIPQGIAYGLLGNLPPVAGIYMAFFPVLIYFFFGTSRHISIGTFAIVCLMTGQVVATYAPESLAGMKNDTLSAAPNLEQPIYTPMEVATTVTFVVAIMQMAMYILRLGVLTTLLSETLVNGFTCGAAIHVISSQLKDLFGFNLVKRRGKFQVVYTVYDAILAVPQANKTAVSISLVAIVVMVLNNEILKPWLAKRTKIPFPIELLVVLVGTVLCYCLDFNQKYGVSIVGDIPTGLPAPALPAFSLMPYIAVDSLMITIVSYTITMSMALIFAQKSHYEVDANQELLAMSLSNGFGSFFSSMPITGSLARSVVQYNAGGVTQLASIVSCSLLLIVLLWIGPLFESLPKCILGSIIVVALKSMLIQCTMLKKFWILSKWDALVWVVTFLTTVLISIDVGLICGIATSLLSIFIRGQRPYTCLLGVVPDTDLYLDSKRYKRVTEIDDIKIFHYCGALNFASKARFKSLLIRKVGIDPTAIALKRASRHHIHDDDVTIKCIILDLSAISYIDPSGAELLRSLVNEYKYIDISLFIANCSGPIQETLTKCDKYGDEKTKLNIFPTIHDAVLYAKFNEI